MHYRTRAYVMCPLPRDHGYHRGRQVGRDHSLRTTVLGDKVYLNSIFFKQSIDIGSISFISRRRLNLFDYKYKTSLKKLNTVKFTTLLKTYVYFHDMI